MSRPAYYWGDLTDDEHAALTAAARKVIDEDRYPMSPRLGPLKSALAKLDPAWAPKPRPLPEAFARSRRSAGETMNQDRRTKALAK